MDDLLDLSWSDSPAPQPPRAPGAGSSASAAPSRTASTTPSAVPSRTASAFDFLAKPAGGPNYSRTSTPLAPTPGYASGSAGLGGLASGAGGAGAGSGSAAAALNGLLGPSALRPSSRSGAASPAPSPAATGSATPPPSGDAFSSLLGGATGSAAGGASGKNMTMAERQAQLAAEKRAAADAERSRWDHGAFWDSFEGGSGGVAAGNSKNTAPVAAAAAAAVPAAARRSTPLQANIKPTPPTSRPGSAVQQPAASKASGGSFWESGFVSTSAGKRASPVPAAVAKAAVAPPVPPAEADPWDFDSFPSATASSTAAAPVRDFEYPADGGDEDDDLLGDLGRPAHPRRSPPAATREPVSRVGAASPPPHVVGQIVEMGFSPAQARAALATTSTGLDVQAALDSLLAEQGSGGAGDDELDDEAIAREMQAREDRSAADRRARHAARRAGPSREAARPTHRERDYDDDPRASAAGGADDEDLSRQADQLMAQASEIGASVLSKATSFWNQGKERALKAYEEQRKAYEQQQSEKRRPADGRPRWMVEAHEREAAEHGEHRASGGGPRKANGGGRNGHGHGNGNGFHDGPSHSEFRDDFDDDDGHDPVLAPRPTGKQPQQQRAADPRSNLNLSAKDRADLLFADAPAPRQYVSKNRHTKDRGSPAPAPVHAPTPPRAPTPLVHRQLVPAAAAQLASAAQHKAKGNEHFKLGRFAEADAAYASAISALPAGHIVLVTLYNNRAATRLKLGEGAGAAADCTEALGIIGPAYHPSKEAPLPADVDVKLADALVKATTKRAQAWEMTEKWKQALEDWQKVLGFDAGVLTAAGGAAAGAKTLASDGVRRAKAMLSDGDRPKAASSTPAARPSAPKPKPAPSRPTDVNRSAAVGELRKAAVAAGAEEEERVALKDGVDARLNAWRHGKETNLRALVASLDTVLWDGILAGGLKVGMHELVTEKQVKIKYMKVIARLHPDKLKVGDTTVEQRMLANGAFGTLNEAWAAFNGS